jgi:hypothetical protein
VKGIEDRVAMPLKVKECERADVTETINVCAVLPNEVNNRGS